LRVLIPSNSRARSAFTYGLRPVVLSGNFDGTRSIVKVLFSTVGGRVSLTLAQRAMGIRGTLRSPPNPLGTACIHPAASYGVF